MRDEEIRRLAEKYSEIRAKVLSAQQKSSLATDGTTIVGVTKTFPPDVIAGALSAGIEHLGENKAQELRDKASMYPSRSEHAMHQWHFIGSLQKNKAKYIAASADVLHALDSLDVAEALNRRLQSQSRTLSCMVQVNISEEQTKAGLSPDLLFAFIDRLSDFSNLSIRGLMTIGAFHANPEDARGDFEKLRHLRDRARETSGLDLEWLSMGMSHDFEVAVEEGATHIRLGTALFGQRPTGSR